MHIQSNTQPNLKQRRYSLTSCSDIKGLRTIKGTGNKRFVRVACSNMLQCAPIIAPIYSNALIRMSRNCGRSVLKHVNIILRVANSNMLLPQLLLILSSTLELQQEHITTCWSMRREQTSSEQRKISIRISIRNHVLWNTQFLIG